MPRSIYDQMAGALAQMTKYADRTILFRGHVLPCVVLVGDTSTKLVPGGLEAVTVVHIKVLRSVIEPALGQGGDPRTNEFVTYPAEPMHHLEPYVFKIADLIPESFAWSFTLEDPSR